MSEIKRVSTDKADLLLVKVPEKSGWFETRPGQGIAPPVLVYNFGPNKFMSEIIHLPEGNWQTIGLSTDLTEEQCREVVDPVKWADGCFKNYAIKEQFVGLSGRRSFDSLMKSGDCIVGSWIVLKRQ